MNCRKYRTQIFAYRDGTLSPRQKEELDAHLSACPRCRAEFDTEENLAHGFRESFKTATASVFPDPNKAMFTGRENLVPSFIRPNAALPAARKLRALRWLAAGAGAAIILAAVFLGPFKPGKRDALLTSRMNAESLSLHSDDLADPFQDWIQRRMIITVVDKSAGTTEKYLTDRAGTIRKIAEQGRN